MLGLSCTTAIMIALSALMVSCPRAGLWAAFVYVTHPMAMVYDVVTLPDGLDVALLATSVFFFCNYLRDHRLVHLAISGFFVEASVCLTR